VIESHLEMSEMNMEQPPVSPHVPTQAEIAAFVQQQVQAALASQQRPVSIKPATPRSYSGDKGGDPEVWLFQYEQCARLYNLTDAQKVDHAATYLEGAAATWWRSVALASDRSGTPRPTWDSFKAQLITLFKPVNASKVARDHLAELKQTGAVFRYNTDFNRLVLEAGNVSADEQLHRYIRGLKPKIRVEVELADPQTVHTAMEKAQRIDTITWYARTEYNSSYKSTPAFSSNTYAPMDLSALKIDPKQEPNTVNVMSNNKFRSPNRERYAPPMTKEEYERCRREGLCLKCKKSGHTARFCLANKDNYKPNQPVGKGSAR
jgi:hypothetical protein